MDYKLENARQAFSPQLRILSAPASGPTPVTNGMASTSSTALVPLTSFQITFPGHLSQHSILLRPRLQILKAIAGC